MEGTHITTTPMSGTTNGDDEPNSACHSNGNGTAVDQLKDPLAQLRNQSDGALNQCINELTSNFRRCVSEITATPAQLKEVVHLASVQSVQELNRRNSQGDLKTIAEVGVIETMSPPSPPGSSSTKKASASHFVTVIEVKEITKSVASLPSLAFAGSGQQHENAVTATISGPTLQASSDKSEMIASGPLPPTPEIAAQAIDDSLNLNNQHQQCVNKKEMPLPSSLLNAAECGTASSDLHVPIVMNSLASRFSDFGGNGIATGSGSVSDNVPSSQLSQESVKQKSAAFVAAAAAITTTTTAASAQDVKKKVPPRPPPKFIRRAAPVDPPTVPTTESPSSSLERNIKPSEIFRQKSCDSLDTKVAGGERRGNLLPSVKLSKSIDEKSSRVSEQLIDGVRHALESGKPTTPSTTDRTITGAQVSASPTGSLSKIGVKSRSINSPTSSLDKAKVVGSGDHFSAGSKESLTSQGAISNRIKSYESISSLSLDSAKANHQHHSNIGHNNQQLGPGIHQALLESEPFYDTVPLDNGDGDYVYIQAGGSGSTSSRDDISMAGSTLPLASAVHGRSQLSGGIGVSGEPESPGRSSNYVNIDYFLQHEKNHKARSSSIDSDGDGDSEPPPALMRAISHDDTTPSTFGSGDGGVGGSSGGAANRNTIIRHIIASIIASETLYVECLDIMMKYMQAFRATLTLSQPVISQEEFQTMFFKIDNLHAVHSEFLNELKTAQKTENDACVGEIFKNLANHIHLYGAFLHNYGRAIDTVKKCGANNHQFKEIVSKIVLNSANEQSLTLEELLHKPVARVQKNALVLQDLLNETPAQHVDYQPLRQAQKIIRNFLSEFNVIQTKTMFPSDDKALRRLVKNSFIVELADGHRKLRHLFLFNDVIACAKYKASGRDRFEFELKWFIPLRDIVILEESSLDPKEASPINILTLKSQACTVRDQILLDDKDDKKNRAGDKHRKKLADLEAQLVLVSPNLLFRIGNKSANKTMIFYLSSDFERTQWIESIISLQQCCNLPGVTPVQICDLQAWIAACQTLFKTDMGSYLMRNSRDESLLVGDLHLIIQGLQGLDHLADLFICIEIDSYGHYFRKAKTKLICRSVCPLWNESFVLELEGSQNVRILLYEDQPHRPKLRAKHVLKLSRQWLTETTTIHTLKMTDTVTLNMTIRFVPGEVTLRRVPTSKPGALFGAKMQQVLKREKRDIPFIISACIREVERRGICEVGIYRVSGSASDLARLKKSFETNPYEAEQLLKEVDIHSVTGILKSFLRDLPEALFTDLSYPRLFDTFNKYSNFHETARIEALQGIFSDLPICNKATITLILEHLIRVHQQEPENKMSLHNLAMVFGPTLLRPGPQITKQKDLLESSTVDVMAQAGILYCFLQAKIK